MKTVCVFDSGVGGLSVLRALLADMPGVRFVYLADSAYAPYGERTAAWIRERSHQIVHSLRDAFEPDAMVVACNTATALAIDTLRETYADLPFVGVEPALKPAARISTTGHIGVMATRGTLASERFSALKRRLEQDPTHPAQFHCVACDGLADAIERDDQPAIHALSALYWGRLKQSADERSMDTLVLGCTHYPFIADVLTELAGPTVTLVETGAPVARRTREVLKLPVPDDACSDLITTPALLTTGAPPTLEHLAGRWLQLQGPAKHWAC